MTILYHSPSLELILPDLTTIPVSSCPSHPSPPPSLTNIPPELHALIIPHLAYPDALALKHTCTLFYHLVPTPVWLKVRWLIERHARGLPCPQKKCVMKTDALFCKGEVQMLMERRRRHSECGSRGCEVVVGMECEVSERRARKLGRLGMGMGKRRGRFESFWSTSLSG